MMRTLFSKYDNFIFDLDGTVWRWTRLVENILPVFNEIERLKKNCYFITNNCLLTREGLRKKLQGFGINAEYEHIINPSIPACNILKKKRVLCIGEGLISELKKMKIKISSRANAVIVSESRNFTYDILSKACLAVADGAEFYKTAAGSVFIYGNKHLPGTGAIAGLIENTTGTEAENIGKPSEHMAGVVKLLELNPEKTILFGDELDSDISFGNMLGFTTVFVLTGRDTKEQANSKPDLILNSIANIVKG